ncbi:hypothetical protein MGG_17203 [Pyricularia oryzae 70-15]|uniref:Uncharacterized protein n=3 Tax=Pyricularia oryzae TaxID=318829 RepID=G4N8G3_PYRO7|nr:uncharacterized protein MGG_17203 [Pyricularia oryzae 70-15]EHA51011.1 hypothetical protein MGG_17203 [Pyricularia oryzae 70-15]ELQ34710.1 hypothetical protein OOU_Y34scaffold00748g29 [Pyricularia oryzae Y34]
MADEKARSAEKMTRQEEEEATDYNPTLLVVRGSCLSGVWQGMYYLLDVPYKMGKAGGRGNAVAQGLNPTSGLLGSGALRNETTTLKAGDVT